MHATGTWNGQNTLHVPVSWCIVQGSPAQASPNVAGDTTTDDLIWRRHERPTDNIYVNVSGITFRSAIDNAWTVLDFPILTDPDTTLGTPGDVRGENISTNGTEFNQLINACDTAYNNLGRAGVGVTAVNVGLFHDGTGNYNGVPIGWGGCAQSIATPNVCVSPYTGFIMVDDNHYFFPSVPNRTWPGTTMQFFLTDPLDQLVGHELGHALGLPHRSLATALMNPMQTDNNGDGQTDNIGLNATEVTELRSSAVVVPGLEQDPLGRIIKGDVIVLRKPDKVREKKELKPYEDLGSVQVTLDLKKEEVSLGQHLFGLLPKEGMEQSFWWLVSTDKGATSAQLRELGVPASRFTGATLVIRADVHNQRITGSAWRLQDGNLVPIEAGFRFDILAMVMYPHYAAGDSKYGFPINHIVNVTLSRKLLPIELKRPFRIQTIIAAARTKIPADKLDDTAEERGVEFVLDYPSFPHCSAPEQVAAGNTVKIEIEHLRPSTGIHGLLGPRMVFRGETDQYGGGTIDFEIPKDTTPGFHLVTIGNDRTALTADCVVNVVAQKY